jgi:type II secretory pathway pseudopilin PulG
MKKFTLVELMFCVGILVVLISIGMYCGSKIMRKSAETQMKAEIKMIHTAIRAYKGDNEQYPISDDPKIITFADSLIDLNVIKQNDGMYIDAYGNPYEYIMEDDQMKVFSINLK